MAERVARPGDTFPCAVQTPHEAHLFDDGRNPYRCAGDDTDTRLDRQGRPDQVGRCGNRAPALFSETPAACCLPSGHPGWHRADDGSEWDLTTETTDEQTTFITIDVDTLARRIAERIAARQAEVADSFVRWGMENEIAIPPIDWAWFGEIARRYSTLHEEHTTPTGEASS